MWSQIFSSSKHSVGIWWNMQRKVSQADSHNIRYPLQWYQGFLYFAFKNCIGHTFPQPSVDWFGWNFVKFWPHPRSKVLKSKLVHRRLRKGVFNATFEGKIRKPKLKIPPLVIKSGIQYHHHGQVETNYVDLTVLLEHWGKRQVHHQRRRRPQTTFLSGKMDPTGKESRVRLLRHDGGRKGERGRGSLKIIRGAERGNCGRVHEQGTTFIRDVWCIRQWFLGNLLGQHQPICKIKSGFNSLNLKDEYLALFLFRDGRQTEETRKRKGNKRFTVTVLRGRHLLSKAWE